MFRLVIVVVIVGAIAFAWNQGWIANWFNTAVDSSSSAVKQTRQNASKVRSDDPVLPEKKD